MKFSKFKQLSEDYFVLKNEIYVESENLKAYLKAENKDALKTVKEIVDMEDLEKMYDKTLETDIDLKRHLLPLVKKIISCKENERTLQALTENVYNKLEIFNLFNVNQDFLLNQIEIFLNSHNISYDKIQSKISNQFFTNIYSPDGQRLVISLYNTSNQKQSARQIFKNMQNYYLAKSKPDENGFNFMQILRSINPQYAKEMYDIIWSAIKHYYDKIIDDKILKEQAIIVKAKTEIENYSNPTYIQKRIEQNNQEIEKLNEQLKDVKWKILMDEKLRYNNGRKKKIEEDLSFYESENKLLSNPKFRNFIIDVDTHMINKSSAKIKQLNRNNADSD